MIHTEVLSLSIFWYSRNWIYLPASWHLCSETKKHSYPPNYTEIEVNSTMLGDGMRPGIVPASWPWRKALEKYELVLYLACKLGDRK